MDASHVLEIVSQIIMGVLAWNATRVIHILDDLKNSVEKLNVSMAVIVDKTTGHEKELSEHRGRIRTLEIHTHTEHRER